MPRIVRDQIIASTSLDSHSERLPEVVLTRYFEQMVDGAVGATSHDLAQVPAFRSFNKRLVRTADGDLAIMVDLEVLDEDRFATSGGFSISFTRRRQQFGYAPSYPRITINARQFDFESTAKRLSEHLAGTPFELVERVEKADAITLAIVGIAVGAYLVVKVTASAIASAFSGFFEEAGKDLYHVAKDLIRADQPSGPVEVQFHLHIHEPPKRPVIIVRVDPRCTTADVAGISAEKLEMLLDGIDADAFDRISADVMPGGELKRTAAFSTTGEQLRKSPGKPKPRSQKKRRRR